jgi:hypothetical protein
MQVKSISTCRLQVRFSAKTRKPGCWFLNLPVLWSDLIVIHNLMKKRMTNNKSHNKMKISLNEYQYEN